MTPWKERVEIGPHVLYLGDCREVAAHVKADAVVSDPPYGMAWDTDSTRFSGGEIGRGTGVDWSPIESDDEPFDPSPWIEYGSVVLFGVNHFAQRVPPGTTLVWIKRADHLFGSFLSDAELAWMKGGHGVYCFRKQFPPPSRMVEGNGSCVHPTQKPVALMAWCIERGAAKAETILDPFMGSGTTGVACAKLGRKFIGVEIHEPYFRIACRRVADAHAGGVQPELFAAKPREADTAQEALFQ